MVRTVHTNHFYEISLQISDPKIKFSTETNFIKDGHVQNFGKYKNIILFMGKSGRKILNDTLKIWDLDYEEKKSLTSKNSFLLNIKNMEKKI